MNIKRLNEEMWKIQDNFAMNEMAKIEKVLIIHNDKEPGQEIDNLKFAHFHYNDIHFRFRQVCPKNITELKEMIAFESEKKKITSKELANLLKLLQRKPIRTRVKADTVYDLTLAVWEILNEREADFIK